MLFMCLLTTLAWHSHGVEGLFIFRLLLRAETETEATESYICGLGVRPNSCENAGGAELPSHTDIMCLDEGQASDSASEPPLAGGGWYCPNIPVTSEFPQRTQGIWEDLLSFLPSFLSFLLSLLLFLLFSLSPFRPSFFLFLSIFKCIFFCPYFPSHFTLSVFTQFPSLSHTHTHTHTHIITEREREITCTLAEYTRKL